MSLTELTHWLPTTDRRVAHPALTLSRRGLVAIVVAAGVLAGANVQLSISTQAAVYLFGMVALNLPHGGYEQFTNLRRRAGQFRFRYVGAYLVMVAAFLGLFFLAPLAGLAVAVAIACLKGGLGGLHVLDVTSGTDHLAGRWQRWLAVAVRGGVVMLVPLALQPGTFSAYSTYMVSMFDPAAIGPFYEQFGTKRLLAGGGWLALAGVHVGAGYLRGGGRSWRVDAGETALLGLYFAVVPVVVAVGLYFPLWYSARQVARHEQVDRDSHPGRDLLDGDSTTEVALRAWAMLVAGAIATGTVVAAIWLLAPNPLGTAPLLPGLVAFWSISISLIALPHVAIGSLADRQGGIWYVP